MLKSIVALFMLSVLLVGTCSKSILVLNYVIQKDYFAKELCEKKSIPGNCCKGKCELYKEIKEDNKREGGSSPLVLPKNEISVFELSSFSCFFYCSAVIIFHPEVVSELPIGGHFDILRPPAFGV